MVLHRPSDQWRGVVGVFGWGWGVNWFLLFGILGAVMGAIFYLSVMTWGCLLLGDLVKKATGSEALACCIYLTACFGGLTLPIAIGVSL